MAIEKIKILAAVLELPANLAHLLRNQAKWGELALLSSWSSKTAPRILIFSTAMGAKPSFYMKSIAT